MTRRARPARESMAARLQAAQNAHDLEAMLACFAPDYRSEQPAHDGRGFSGRETVGRHWARFFDEIPDFRVEILRSTTDGEHEWVEYRWHGTHRRGFPFDVRGVVITGIRDGRIAWARLYMEPVEHESREHTV